VSGEPGLLHFQETGTMQSQSCQPAKKEKKNAGTIMPDNQKIEES
jgi:hypothetical protein